MAAHGDVKHDYHLVDPSPWPIVGSFGLFVSALGFVTFAHGFVESDSAFAWIAAKGHPWLALLGLALILYTMYGWWSDVVRESRKGDHTPVVDIGLRYGMILFIASEIMFFAAWFWIFFDAAIFPESRAMSTIPEVAEAWKSWPPVGIETFDPFHLPLMNTLVLLLSGTTVTWAHHAIQQGDRKSAIQGLAMTVALGLLFTTLQVVEYSEAKFAFGSTADGVTATGLYGSSFFMATGFHGAHVVIGTIFLAVCLMRTLAGQFTPQKHFGFEAAAWYWHFVDVVWLFLFAFVYVTFG